MQRTYDSDQCSLLYDNEERLTRLVARDEERRQKINTDIRALNVEIEKLRHEKAEIENELSPVVFDPPGIERRRGRIRPKPARLGNVATTAAGILSGEIDADRRRNELQREISRLTSERNEKLREQSERIRLRDETLAGRAEVRRERDRSGCPGARSNFF